MSEEIGPFDPGPFIKATMDLLGEEFGEQWWWCPVAQRLAAISFSVFSETDIIKYVPFTIVRDCLEYKREGTFEGKPLPKDFATNLIDKILRGPDLCDER